MMIHHYFVHPTNPKAERRSSNITLRKIFPPIFRGTGARRSVFAFRAVILLPSLFLSSGASFCSSSSTTVSGGIMSSSSSSSSSLLSAHATTENNDGMSLKQMAIERAILPLSETCHKGSSGRIAILGGSAKFTGAPYYAATASLQAGADLAYVFTAEEAAVPIKCYSPELMVIPVYRAADFDQAEEKQQQQEQQHNKNNNEETTTSSIIMSSQDCQMLVQNMVQEVISQIQRVHCLVIGPGLGRSPLVFEAVSLIIQEVRSMGLHLVLDADALYMLSLPQYQTLLQGYEKAIITPNAMEYKRLFPVAVKNTSISSSDGCEEKNLEIGSSPHLQGVTIVRKGRTDVVERDGEILLVCVERGGLKRSGGIGDVLAGTLGTLISWNTIMEQQQQHQQQSKTTDLSISCWTACWIVKRATARAFSKKKRAMTAPDVLEAIGSAMEEFTTTTTTTTTTSDP